MKFWQKITSFGKKRIIKKDMTREELRKIASQIAKERAGVMKDLAEYDRRKEGHSLS